MLASTNSPAVYRFKPAYLSGFPKNGRHLVGKTVGKACGTRSGQGQSVNGGNRIELIRRASPASTVGSLRGEFELQRWEVSWTGRLVAAGLWVAMVHWHWISQGLFRRLRGRRFDRSKTAIGAIPISHLVPLYKLNRTLGGRVSVFRHGSDARLRLRSQESSLPFQATSGSTMKEASRKSRFGRRSSKPAHHQCQAATMRPDAFLLRLQSPQFRCPCEFGWHLPVPCDAPYTAFASCGCGERNAPHG